VGKKREGRRQASFRSRLSSGFFVKFRIG